MRYLIGTLLASTFLCLPVMAQDTPRPALKPRVEANLRAGTERSIAMSEFWVPLAQDAVQGSVLYGDARFMGDDKENNEFNLGVGYREIVTDVPVLGNGVAGVHGWVDRRHTERGAAFNQITAGAEWHGEAFDIKANAYIPLNKSKTHAAGTTTTAPYLAGSGIFYDITNMKLIEEAQPGFDLELGLNVSGIVDGFADSARVYAGAYHFSGDKSDDVTGWRTRVASDITQDVQLGARFQRDDERGSQGFLEATIRFPFGNKQSYKQHGLYARLDESPERDIDIVTGTVTGGAAGNTLETRPVLNATSGDAQRVLYVDNSAGAGGTGTLNNPFNSLADAQADLRDNDVVYVARGDGLTTNMDTGFHISRHGVSLIGEGSNFVYDGGKFTTGDGVNFSGTLLKAAGLAPTITNTASAANVNDAFITGAGIYTAGYVNSVFVSGVNVANTGGMGIHLGTNSGTTHVSNVTITNTAYDGLHINVQGTSNVDLIDIKNVNVSGMLAPSRFGIVAYATQDSTLGAIRMSDVTLNNNTLNFRLYSNINAVVNNIELDRVTATNATGAYDGTIAVLSNATINRIRLNDVTTNSTRPNGMAISATAAGQINAVSITNLQSRNHSSSGLLVSTATDSSIHNVRISNSAFTGNNYGVYLDDNSTGSIDAVLTGNNLAGNTTHGLRLDLDGAAVNAQGNWWGQAGGPIGAQVANEGACPACGIPDTSNALSGAP